DYQDPVDDPPFPGRLVWRRVDHDANDPDLIHERPVNDTAYTVNIANVTGPGVPTSFTYTVTVFDPQVASANAPETALVPSDSPTSFLLQAVDFAEGYQLREVRTASYLPVFDAEAPLGDFAPIVGDYDPRGAIQPLAGNVSYRVGV